ncbi:Sulfatase [Roseivivax sp. THAF40]|uniref:sulfatase-like hydrolase/transferase n=1 Tax=unclassified Roseivivax TaxID=2639302 RepID=UPI0012A87EC3|nr:MULTISPECIES: sulfatase-like hydrolase/transferase [unclassified Roseivivax]QFS81816.1 Sulfatase [Roseivivax sp. THAF197b]QFT45616.1 Sulfatase [Roseivivax sp. THAF40]
MTDLAPRHLLRLTLAALVLHILLVQPNHPAAMTWEAPFLFALELPLILLALVLVSGPAATALRVFLTFALTLIAVLKTADFAMFTALARGFNPVADLVLIDAGLRLLAGSAGTIPAILTAIGAILATLTIAAAIWWASGIWAALSLGRRAWPVAGIGIIALAGLVTAEIGQAWGKWRLPVSPPGAAFTTRVGLERISLAQDTLTDLRAFRRAAITDPLTYQTGLLDRIDRDVVIVFVESYGRTSLDTPYYADLHRETLRRNEARLRDLGLAMRSGVLEAPTRGGQSWLSHATFANGLWVNDQTRYGAALASGRETLFHIAARSGFHTAAVMPQITLDWPESLVMGFDTVLAAADLAYEGEPFNWVTMPDQYTYSAMDRLLRDPVTDKPVFVQVATGTSHAPWVPIPELVPWDEIGDGRIFNDMATSGDTPEVVWRDRDRVRLQYRKAIDYALDTVFDYAARHAETPPLMIVLGDHQAADFVSLDDNAQVPMHVVGPPDLVARIDDWNWAAGLVPDEDTPVLPMDRMRDRLIEAFSSDLRIAEGET